jgi:hypothetical protein
MANRFYEIFYKVTDKRSLNESLQSNMKFNYDNKGNWIPVGYEDKMIAIRPVEQPMGSGNEKYLIVQLSPEGEFEETIKTTDSWEEAKKAIIDSII